MQAAVTDDQIRTVLDEQEVAATLCLETRLAVDAVRLRAKNTNYEDAAFVLTTIAVEPGISSDDLVHYPDAMKGDQRCVPSPRNQSDR